LSTRQRLTDVAPSSLSIDWLSLSRCECSSLVILSWCSIIQDRVVMRKAGLVYEIALVG
jgi:hypothetical protein